MDFVKNSVADCIFERRYYFPYHIKKLYMTTGMAIEQRKLTLCDIMPLNATWMDNQIFVAVPEVIYTPDTKREERRFYINSPTATSTTVHHAHSVPVLEQIIPGHPHPIPMNTLSIATQTKKQSEVAKNLHVDTRRPLVCTWCKETCMDKTTLLDHVKAKHYLDREHRCSICLKLFTQKSNLKAHYRIHTGERPYKCEFCDRTFAQKSNLVNHLLVHTLDKPHKCPICDRAFAQKSNLKSHILTHTGEKPHNCPHCGKNFIQKSNLASHFRIHTMEKPHHCNICNKFFAQRSNLLSHMRVHTKYGQAVGITQ